MKLRDVVIQRENARVHKVESKKKLKYGTYRRETVRNITQKKIVQEGYSLKDVKAVVFPSSPFIRCKSVDICKILPKDHVSTVAVWAHMTRQIAKIAKETHLFISSPLKCDMEETQITEMGYAMYNLGRLKCKKKENKRAEKIIFTIDDSQNRTFWFW